MWHALQLSKFLDDLTVFGSIYRDRPFLNRHTSLVSKTLVYFLHLVPQFDGELFSPSSVAQHLRDT